MSSWLLQESKFIINNRVEFATILSVVGEVLSSFTEVQIAITQCINTQLQVKCLHSSKSIKVLALKYTLSTKTKSTHYAE